MLFDEFMFHRQRTLPLWERVGHPIDTFFFLLCFFYCLTIPFNTGNVLNFYIVLGVISTFVVTKDEWIHKELCCATEAWLHSLLFILHPISLYILFLFWRKSLLLPIAIQSAIVMTFLIYQIIYWNFTKRNTDENSSQQ